MRRLLAFLSILCCVSPWQKAFGAESLQDNHNTTRISEVFFGGLELDRAALDQLLKPAEEKADQRQKLAFDEDQIQSSRTSSSQSGNDLAPSTGKTEGDFIIKAFRFNSGEVLPELRLHYITLGTPHRNSSGNIDNAVLLLHSTGSDTTELLEPSFSGPLYGPGEPLDLNKFYLIIPDSIGHGKSSKPSDGLRTHFPHYGYNDMVTAQYRLVIEKLGVAHLRMVLGLSMGAMHAWLWGERYPEMMDGLFPISGLPVEIGGRNRLWRHIIVEAIRNDPELQNDDFDRHPHASSRIAPLVAIITGNPIKQFEKYPTKAAADAWYESILKRVQEHGSATNALYYYDASSDYNPAPDLEKIKAKVFLILFDDDQINSPEFAVLDREMPRVKNGRYVVVHAGKEGNGEGEDNVNAKLWSSQLQSFLQSLSR
jgi:homoserine O-acetyltransferase/O-succinyltransferase